MTKYIQDNIIRSRLTLTYRMHIDGKPVDEKLPFRLLVLGDFSGRPVEERVPLAKRQVIRIPNKTSYQDALANAEDGRGFALRFDEKQADLKPLISHVEATLSGRLSVVPDPDPANAPKATLTGTLTIEGKGWKRANSDKDVGNGLGNFTGQLPVTIPIDDVAALKADPGKIKFTIDLKNATNGKLSDGEVTGEISGKLVPGPVELTCKPLLKDTETNVSVTGTATVELALPIRDLDSFTPDFIGQYVPEIRRLRVIQSLLLDLRSTILTVPELKTALMGLLPKQDTSPSTKAIADDNKPKIDALKNFRTELTKRYPSLAIPPSETARDATSTALPVSATKLVETLHYNNQQTFQNTALVTASDAAHRTIVLQDRNSEVHDADRFLNSLAAFFVNVDDDKLAELTSITALTDKIAVLSTRIEGAVNNHLTHVLDIGLLRTLEKNWRGLAELCADVSDDLVEIDVLDVSQEELQSDLVDHDVDIMTSDLFRKMYHDEYDRYGGKPYGVMIGLYSFDCTKSDDLGFIQTMSKVANLAHCPFIAAVKPEFFGCDSMAKVEAIVDLDKVMTHPRYGKWNAFRETDGAGYIGLTLPGYLLRQPWGAVDDSPGNRKVKYQELKTFVESKLPAARDKEDPVIKELLVPAFRDRDKDEFHYLWGNPAILFARNLVRSFQLTGWCQRIRGQRGGGLIEGLAVHAIERKGRTEIQPPVEMAIPDFRELQFSNQGFIPLVWRKDSSDATFFGARSTKKALEFQNEIDTQNADLVCNLAYTFSITRIAHYVKLMARPYIGTTADATYLQTMIENWLKGYVTTVVDPDDLTVQRYPFRAISVTVKPKPGPLGWYTSVVSILPHVQFEGMDVELRLEAALGGAK